MQVSAFDYHLPEKLIAERPLANRSDSRLMVVSKTLQHQQFSDITQHFQPGDALIMNDTKVMSARLFAKKSTGGAVEVLIERILSPTRAKAHCRANRSLKEGTILELDGNQQLVVTGRDGGLYLLDSRNGDFHQLMLQYGSVPLPHYMQRQPTKDDDERYQTVYATELGSVAAPTAGLHFTQDLLAALRHKGVTIKTVTLHVGAGTFQPVRCEDLRQHKMHSEWFDVAPDVVEAIKEAKRRHGRVFAVGTTTLRSLESAARQGGLQPYVGETDLFIFPGFKFNVVDKLITNFHLPKSTLLMLVSAFAGSELIRESYRAAIEAEYRFFSYGDAMLLTREQNNAL